ncbi:hypothetical protein GGX14DRAFT_701320 [Mycena pura]|uniref:GmrSD restriction endonucleases N-terminal domain-containing protein n=1 Tax=Mycena pura TaxID=153505 RepID=A0AAD6UR05_9AGAR|nr:hypothetical protein GGX14DRAFT_701320 [Mycena pura]
MDSGNESSDLTDLDELSEEFEAPIAKKKGKGKKKATTNPGGYRIRHALKAPRATTYSAESLYKQIHNGDINLEPDYQREVVWPESKQIGIIDSIFRNFYVPPVIFALNTFDDGTETRTCIDGKQRLTSIHRFMQGLIPHKDNLTGDKLWYRDNPDNRTRTAKKLLPEKYRKLFDNKAVVCVEYADLSGQDEREIFQRVQLGVALTPAEKLKILTTPRATFVRALQDAFLNNDESALGGSAFAWDRSRGSDFRCLAQTFQCIEMNPKTTSIQATEKWLADPKPMSPAFAAAIENTYRVFEALAERSDGVLNKISPVEFITVGILIYKHRNALTLEGVSLAVREMRADVRQEHEDIRNNGKVYKTMSTFINKYRAPALVRGQVSAAEAVDKRGPSISIDAEGRTTVNGTGAGTKRKARAQESDDNDEDSDADYAPAHRAKAVPRKRSAASPTKPATTRAPPTPPTSTSTAAQLGSPSAPMSDPIRAAMERIKLQREAGTMPLSSQGNPALTPGQTPFSFMHPQQMPMYGQQQSQHGAAGVAAALEQNLMASVSGGWPGGGGTPNGSGSRVKTEAGAGPMSAGSNGSWSQDGGTGRGYGGHTRGQGREYDRDRDRRDYDHDYEHGRGGSARYRERDRDYGRRY